MRQDLRRLHLDDVFGTFSAMLSSCGHFWRTIWFLVRVLNGAFSFGRALPPAPKTATAEDRKTKRWVTHEQNKDFCCWNFYYLLHGIVGSMNYLRTD